MKLNIKPEIAVSISHVVIFVAGILVLSDNFVFVAGLLVLLGTFSAFCWGRKEQSDRDATLDASLSRMLPPKSVLNSKTVHDLNETGILVESSCFHSGVKAHLAGQVTKPFSVICEYLSELPDLFELEFSSIGNSPPTDLIRDIQTNGLSPIAKLTELRSLGLDHLGLQDISKISHLKKLRRLSLWSNNIEDLSPLASLENLMYLDVSDNPVSNIGTLSNCTKLVSINLGKTKVTSLQPLETLQKLKDLEVFSMFVEKEDTPVSREEIQRFKTARPKVTVDYPN